MADVDPGSAVEVEHSSSTKRQLVAFSILLALALIGMGFTQSRENGGWEYWLFLVLVYAGVSITRTWRRRREPGKPIAPMLRTQLLHWVGLIVMLKLLFVMEYTDVISREAAGDIALLLLALGCYLAGVHFDWQFLLIGVVLTVMAVAMAYLQVNIVWMMMIPLAIGAAVIFYVIAKKRVATSG